ncbi:MAG TPA: hypothetical protein VF149_04745 [Bacillales bacterium]
MDRRKLEKIQLENPETSGAGEVRALPFEKAEEKLRGYFGDEGLVE